MTSSAVMPPSDLLEPLADHISKMPLNWDVLVRRPTPEAALARRAGTVQKVPLEELASLAGRFDCVADAGELAACGLHMDLRTLRWDVLGRVEEALRAVAALLS